MNEHDVVRVKETVMATPQRDLPISWNIAPTQDVLAMRFNPETKLCTLDTLRWGLIPNWAKDPKIVYKTINGSG
jgi:putative SOS response-associated peptidase YedK